MNSSKGEDQQRDAAAGRIISGPNPDRVSYIAIKNEFAFKNTQSQHINYRFVLLAVLLPVPSEY